MVEPYTPAPFPLVVVVAAALWDAYTQSEIVPAAHRDVRWEELVRLAFRNPHSAAAAVHRTALAEAEAAIRAIEAFGEPP